MNSSRRSFLSALVAVLVPASVIAQSGNAIVEKGKAVVCNDYPIKCPNGHDTCRSIDATLVVGNDSRDYPNTAQLFDFHLERCEVCHVLFTRE